MNIKQPYFVLLLLLLGISLHAQESMSMRQAVEYAWQNSPMIKEAELSLQDAEQQIIERRSVGLPQLSASANLNHYLKIPEQPLPAGFGGIPLYKEVTDDISDLLSPGTQQGLEVLFNTPSPDGVAFALRNSITAGLNLNTMLFDGTYFVGLQAARAFRDYTNTNLKAKRQDVGTNAVRAYLPALLVEENKKILDKNIANLEKILYETDALYQEGFVEQLDVDRLRLSLANLQTQRKNLDRQGENVLRGLKLTINYPLEQELVITDDMESLMAEMDEMTVISEENLDNMDYSGREALNLIEQTIQLNELNIKNNRAAYLPKLFGFANAQTSYYGEKLTGGFWAPSAAVGLTLNVPIFSGLGTKARVQRATIDLEKARVQKEQVQNGIELEVRNAHNLYLAAKDELASTESNLELAQRIYDTTQIKYREGVGSSIEVTQAEQSLYTAQSNHIQALYNLVSARVDLRLALGI